MSGEDKAPGLKSFRPEDIVSRMESLAPDFFSEDDSIEAPDEALDEIQDEAPDEAPDEELETAPEDDLDGLDDVADDGTVELVVDGTPRYLKPEDVKRYAQLGLHHSLRGKQLNELERDLKEREQRLEQAQQLAEQWNELERRLSTPEGMKQVLAHLYAAGQTEEEKRWRQAAFHEVLGTGSSDRNEDPFSIFEEDAQPERRPQVDQSLARELESLKAQVQQLTQEKERERTQSQTEQLRSRLQGSMKRHEDFLPEKSPGYSIVMNDVLSMLARKPDIDLDVAVDAAASRLRQHFKELQRLRAERMERSKELGTISPKDGADSITPEARLTREDLRGPGLASKILNSLGKGLLP